MTWLFAAIRTRAGRAVVGILTVLVAVGLLRRDAAQWALRKRDADDMADAYNRERTRDEIDRNTAGPDARDRLRKSWRRD